MLSTLQGDGADSKKPGLQKDRHFFVEKTTAHYLNHFASLRWLQRPVWTISFPKTIKNQTRTPLHKCFHLHASCGCSVNIYTKDYFYFLIASNFISTGCNHVGSLDLYQWRAEKGQLMTYLPHAGLVHDITTADCWAQNGSTHCDFFPYFQTSIFNKHDKKLCAKLLCVYFLFHFYWLGLWYLLGSIPL